MFDKFGFWYYNNSMEIIKNYKLDECIKIFENNHKRFVFDKSSITDPIYTKYVCIENGEPIGYAVVYPPNDFIAREQFACNYISEPDSIYIWHIVVHSAHCGKGVGKFINDAILADYKGRPIYCAIDKNNLPSLHLHQKQGFAIVAEFTQMFHGNMTTFAILRHA